MSREISGTPAALSDLERLSRQDQESVGQSVYRLAEMGHGDVKRLQGVEAEWPLRVVNLRVRFTYDAQTIRVLRALPRGRVYRG